MATTYVKGIDGKDPTRIKNANVLRISVVEGKHIRSKEGKKPAESSYVKVRTNILFEPSSNVCIMRVCSPARVWFQLLICFFLFYFVLVC